ncbi:photosystem II reaction center X protein [Oscillatoriales cyanobacterium LEGE 11467]|uniref:Photosystem II reaction center protein X n=1 Tax=Zarconia navalis LEGE 11467 TaxID=1828826 RepID=A0A928VZW0_9CYAN|nr:photosystem II reaction center X protein [Zarconia navalis]MBE9042674.1 photosystem II reaction center X protein [Zarconia navalis LEGE 11467]
MTPSLTNFFYSLLAGTIIVVIPATVGLIFISQKDKVRR